MLTSTYVDASALQQNWQWVVLHTAWTDFNESHNTILTGHTDRQLILLCLLLL